MDAKGAVSRSLYAVGPLTRGAFWEITAVPDIRGQAAAVAAELLAELGLAVERPLVSRR